MIGNLEDPLVSRISVTTPSEPVACIFVEARLFVYYRAGYC